VVDHPDVELAVDRTVADAAAGDDPRIDVVASTRPPLRRKANDMDACRHRNAGVV